MEPIICTEEHENILFQIPLFRNLPLNIKQTILDKLDHSLFAIDKNEEILKQNTVCKSLFVLLKGRLRVDIIDGLGNVIMVENIIAPRAFATPHLFSTDNILPATFTVIEDGILFTATKDSVFKLISEQPSLLKSFLCITGNCNKCTTTRLRALSHKNVRNRIIAYLLEQRQNDNNIFQIEHNQVQLADYLCVTRPALSKEINKMIKEGLIKMKGKTVELIQIGELERLLL